MNILEQDQEFILGLLDSRIAPTYDNPHMTIVRNLQRFGMKSDKAIKFHYIVDPVYIKATNMLPATLQLRTPQSS